MGETDQNESAKSTFRNLSHPLRILCRSESRPFITTASARSHRKVFERVKCVKLVIHTCFTIAAIRNPSAQTFCAGKLNRCTHDCKRRTESANRTTINNTSNRSPCDARSVATGTLLFSSVQIPGPLATQILFCKPHFGHSNNVRIVGSSSLSATCQTWLKS